MCLLLCIFCILHGDKNEGRKVGWEMVLDFSVVALVLDLPLRGYVDL